MTGRKHKCSLGDMVFHHTGFNIEQFHFLVPVPGDEAERMQFVQFHIGSNMRKIRTEIRQQFFLAAFTELYAAYIF